MALDLPQTEILVYSPWPNRLKLLASALEGHGWPVYARGSEDEFWATYCEKAFDLQFVIGHSDGRFLDYVERMHDLTERRGYSHFPLMISTRTLLNDSDIERAKKLGVCFPRRNDVPSLFCLLDALVDPCPENEIYVEIGHECDEMPEGGLCLESEHVKYMKLRYRGRTEGVDLRPKQLAEADFLARRYARYPGEIDRIVKAMNSSRFLLNQLGERARVTAWNFREDLTRIRQPLAAALSKLRARISPDAILTTLPGHDGVVRFTKNVFVRHFLKSEQQ